MTGHEHNSVRSLPAKPNLEFERKRAKKLLAQLRARGDVDSKLADAQLAIAREYGFRSWPRLVEYFTTLQRHERSQRQTQYDAAFYEKRATQLVERHKAGSMMAARALAAFVPRYYGLAIGEVLAITPTIENARLAIARELRYVSWAELTANATPKHDPWKGVDDIRAQAHRAIREEDLDLLQRIVRDNPAVLGTVPTPAFIAHSKDFSMDQMMYSSLRQERETRTDGARRITDWIATQGPDLGETLNYMLLGHVRMTASDVAFLLERGADPDWVAPNGITVIEHATYRYMNGEAVDVLARRVTNVPPSFWLAAGLGDVSAIDRYVDRAGAPTQAARLSRPDFTAIGPHAVPQLVNADDAEIIWEAFMVAAMNGRYGVMDKLLDHGFPIDYSGWGGTILDQAVGGARAELVEYLARRGALDAVGRDRAKSMAEEAFTMAPADPERRRVLEICGGRSPDEILALMDRHRQKAADSPHVHNLLAAAGRIAATDGRSEIEPEHLFFAMLTGRPSSIAIAVLHDAGADRKKLAPLATERDIPADERSVSKVSGETKRVLQAADEAASDAHRQEVTSIALLFALADVPAVAQIVAACGGSVARVREICRDCA